MSNHVLVIATELHVLVERGCAKRTVIVGDHSDHSDHRDQSDPSDVGKTGTVKIHTDAIGCRTTFERLKTMHKNES